jgi:hypothetical protein
VAQWEQVLAQLGVVVALLGRWWLMFEEAVASVGSSYYSCWGK